MNKKLIGLLILILLTGNQLCKADQVNDVAVQKHNKFIEFFKFKKSKKNDVKNNTSINVDQKTIDELVWDKNKPAEMKETKKLSKTKNSKKQVKMTEIVVPEEVSASTKVMEGGVVTNKIISVDDCIKLAMSNHPAIQSAMSEADIYKSKIAQAWSAYFPTFSLGASYSKNDMLMANFEFPKQKYGLYTMPNIGADMLLFDFGKTKAKVDISKKTYEASKENVQMSINQVIYSVKAAYYNLLFALQQEKVYQDTVKDYELHLKQAEAYYQIGTKAKIDVTTAQYNLGKARLNLIKAKNTVEIAYAQLNNAMGLPEYASYTVTDSLASKVYKVTFDNMLKTSYDTRPELLAAKKKAEASEILIRASVRAFTPDLKAFGNYTLGGKTPAYDNGYQLGAGLSYPTTNLFLLKKQVEESKATYKKDLADYEKVKQNVYFDVKQAYIQLHNEQQSIPVAKLSLKQAEEQYKLASGRYKVGLGDAIELKDAETTYRNAQLDYYNALMNYSVAAANLERVIGVPIKPSDESLL